MKMAWTVWGTHVASGTRFYEGIVYEHTREEAMMAAEAEYIYSTDGIDHCTLEVMEVGAPPLCLDKRPHIYFQRYPSGVGFWKVRRRDGKKHSKLDSALRAHIIQAYTFIESLNRKLDQQCLTQ